MPETINNTILKQRKIRKRKEEKKRKDFISNCLVDAKNVYNSILARLLI